MFFPDDEPEIKSSDPEKIIYVYKNGAPEDKPHEFKISRKRDGFKLIKNVLDYLHLRLFNS